MKVIEVWGNYGWIDIDADRGSILKYTPDEQDDSKENYSNIVRFDVEEYRTYYGYSVEEMPVSIDIVDLGYWNRDGSYEESVYEWRREYRTKKQQ